MFDETKLQRISVAELLDSPERSHEFSTEFAAQFFELPPRKLLTSRDPRYVELDKVIKAASFLCFLLCTYSLILWSISGFALIHPLFSVLAMVAAGTFYCMGMLLPRVRKTDEI